MRRAASVVALTLAALACFAPAASAKRALVAFIPTQPAPRMPLLFDLEQRDFAYGVTSPSIGAYSKRQMVLDMSAGARLGNRAYSRPLRRIDLVWAGRSGRIDRWRSAAERAADAPGDIVPGLFAETLERDGKRIAYSGVLGFEQPEAAVAANRAGRLQAVSLGTIGTFAARTTALLRRSDVVVARFPGDEAGLEALDRIVARRTPDELIYVVRAPPPNGDVKLLPTGVLGPGFRGRTLYSPTTRRTGLVTATDMAPTVLDYLGIAVPDQMEGRVVETRRDGSAEAVRERMARLGVVFDRRAPALRTWGLAFLALIAVGWVARRRDGVRWALRVGFLAALWLPGVALVTGAIAPTRTAEVVALALGSLALGAVVDRLVRWPLAPAVPAAIVLGLHGFDLARGSQWIGASIAGPSPQGGGRFFGIGNELEIMLSMEVLLGLGAALELVPRRLAPRLFALGCLVAAVVIGSGRLGADVGGVITLGAGAAGAVLASLGRPPSRRALAIACLVPAVAVLGLFALDLVIGGGAHLTRTVEHGGVLDAVKRRSVISWRGFSDTTVLVLCVVGVLGFAYAIRRRARLLAPLRPHPAFAAGMWGGLAATIVGALGNDSGPVIFAGGFLVLLLATGYVRGGAQVPGRQVASEASAPSSTMPGCA
jgi:hypothetical protein